MYSIGIDIGTTHVKACLLNDNAEIISFNIQNHEARHSADIGSYYDCDNLWEKVISCIKQVLEGQEISLVKGIGITSMAEAGVPVDEKGNALYPLISWQDKKALTCEFPKHLQGYKLYQKTGLVWHPKYTINRIIWFWKNKPEMMKKMYCWLSVSDYILNRLTGAFKTDVSLASRTMLFNIQERNWDKELVDLAGMEGKLPGIIKEGEELPVIRTSVAKELGLPEKVKVTCSGHDHLCAARAELIRPDEDILNSMGTSEVYLGLLKEPILTEQCHKHGIVQGCFGNAYYWMVNLPTSGASIEWFRNLLSLEKKIDYTIFLQEPLELPSKILYFPYLNGSGSHRSNQVAEGVLLGLTVETGVSDIIQGIYEGISMEVRTILENIKESGAIHIGRIISVGGGTKNGVLMQTKANVTDREYIISEQAQATVIGAAIIVMEGEINKTINRSVVKPKENLQKAYEAKYQKFKQYYHLLWNEHA